MEYAQTICANAWWLEVHNDYEDIGKNKDLLLSARQFPDFTMPYPFREIRTLAAISNGVEYPSVRSTRIMKQWLLRTCSHLRHTLHLKTPKLGPCLYNSMDVP